MITLNIRTGTFLHTPKSHTASAATSRAASHHGPIMGIPESTIDTRKLHLMARGERCRLSATMAHINEATSRQV